MNLPYLWLLTLIVFLAVLAPMNGAPKDGEPPNDKPSDGDRTVELVFRTDAGKRTTVAVSATATRLHLTKSSFLDFGKHEITQVTGLAALTRLRTVILSVVPMMAGFEFLSDAPWIEYLLIHTSSTRDLSFIENLPHLKVVIISETFELKSVELDLSGCMELIYLGISATNLTDLPTLRNAPNSLRYLNLEMNQIKHIDEHLLRTLPSSLEKIFLFGNPLSGPIPDHPALVLSPESEILGSEFYDPFWRQ